MDNRKPPRDKGHLWAWVKNCVRLRVPEGGPLDYLAHAFFEGAGSWEKLVAAGAGGAATSGDPGDGEDDPDPEEPAEGSEERRTADCVVWACRGGGKTVLGALATALDLTFKPGIEVRVLAGSVEQGQRMYGHLRRIVGEPAFARHLRKCTARCIEMENGSRAVLLAQSEASVRGTRVQKIRCDEVELFAPEVWEAVQLTTRSADLGGVRVRGAVEAFSTMHKAYGLMSRIVEEARSGRRRVFRWGVERVLDTCGTHRHCKTPEGAPLCPLWAECGGVAQQLKSEEFRRRRGFFPVRDALAMKARVDIDAWQAEMLCLKVNKADRVLPEFEPDVHVFQGEPPRAARWIGGMDFGFHAPAAVLWAAVDGEGRVWVVDERIRAGVVLDDHIAAILRNPWPRPEWFGVDPAGAARNSHTGRSDSDVMRGAGLGVRSQGSPIAPGLRLIRGRLRAADGGAPRLRVHARCAGLIRAMVQYHYDPAHPDREEPVKDGNDHPIDALRYMLVNLDCPAKTLIRSYA